MNMTEDTTITTVNGLRVPKQIRLGVETRNYNKKGKYYAVKY